MAGKNQRGVDMSDERVTIMLLTATNNEDRFLYAQKTLSSALKNIKYNGPIDVHIADDGSPEENRNALFEMARAAGFDATVSNSDGRGYGANYNAATQVVHSRADYVLPLEDDWELVRPLDLNLFVPALKVFGCVRMGYIGFTQELRGTFHTVAGAIWLRLYEHSREPHVFAGHPRLETVEWERRVGPWPELLAPGRTEFEVAHIPEARMHVCWPLEYVRPSGDLFAHIGTTRSY